MLVLHAETQEFGLVSVFINVPKGHYYLHWLGLEVVSKYVSDGHTVTQELGFETMFLISED